MDSEHPFLLINGSGSQLKLWMQAEIVSYVRKIAVALLKADTDKQASEAVPSATPFQVEGKGGGVEMHTFTNLRVSA